MKYFAVMKDGTIKVADVLYKTQNGKIQFRIDNKDYMYNPTPCLYAEDIYSYKWCARYRPVVHFMEHIGGTPCNIYLEENWIYTWSIEQLIAIDEEEETDMNKFTSTDFNAGFIYAKIDKAMGEVLRDTLSCLDGTVTVPRVQMLPCISCGSVTELDIIEATHKQVCEQFENVFGKTYNLTLGIKESPKHQYIVTYFKVEKKEPEKKEMTIEQIEKELGYKIKVVGNK